MPSESAVAQNLMDITARIEDAATQAGRSGAQIDLVAVSKTHGPDRILPALQAGQRRFGENRVQEAEEKWPDLKKQFPDVILHLIGPLQRNKTKRAVQLFDVIETLDSLKLAETLAREMAAQGRRPDCFIQVNTGEEEQKAGIPPLAVDSFVENCRDRLSLPIVGLMCIPPAGEEPSLHFALLSKIALRNDLPKLSMGMSGDFEVAVRFGATGVRVGTAIFGIRPALKGPAA